MEIANSANTRTPSNTATVGADATSNVSHTEQRVTAYLSGRERMSLASDLLPPCDFFAFLSAAFTSSLLYSLLIMPIAVFGPGWTTRGSIALIGAALAPFILYDRDFAIVACRRQTFRLVGSYTVRFTLTAGLVLAIGGVTHISDTLPLSWLFLWLSNGLLLTALTRSFAARRIRALQHKGVLNESIAVVGAGPIADGLDRYLRQSKTPNVELVGIFDDLPAERAADSIWPVHALDRLLELGKTRTIDWIVIAVPEGDEQRLQSILQRLQALSVPIALCPQSIGFQQPCGTIDYVGNGMPVILLADRPIKRWNAILKTAEDLVLGWCFALLALPVFALVALAIRLDSPGPVIFKQRRHAFNNTEFDIYKFRTMRWQPQSAGEQLQQTARDDERVTRIGKWLRRSSLDELPQLLNILKGEMSLIGPRPHAINMRTEDRLGWEITDRYAHRHRVKPGLTGWSQVNGARGATDTVEQLRRRVELDLFYIEHWSLWLDVKILFMTCYAVLKKTNAY